MGFSDMGEKLKSGEGIEVGPGAEYFEGGLLVDKDYATNLPGLYAAGECAYSLFGANRVMAATMEMLTTGAIAGWSAGEYAGWNKAETVQLTTITPLIEKILRPLVHTDGESPSAMRKMIQEHTQEKLGPIRNAAELTSYLTFLEGLRRELPQVSAQTDQRAYNKSWLETLELENMIQVLGLSAQAALERKESRGVHYREDFPFTDNENWLKEIIMNQSNGSQQVCQRVVNSSMQTPPAGSYPYLVYIKMMMQGHSDIGGHH
jgi:succinate dehydrogenase/fumarate reductase flavoprotein subunit